MEERADGYYTRILGERLQKLIDSEFPGRYQVYYDHKVVNPDSIIAHVDHMCRENNLAELDFAIVSRQNGEKRLVMVAEIEEHKHSPKRFLGDLAAIMLSERIMVGGQDHPMKDMIVLVGLVTKKNGVTGQKASKFVGRFESMIGEGQSGNRNIRCKVLDSTSGEDLVQKVEGFVRAYMANYDPTK